MDFVKHFSDRDTHIKDIHDDIVMLERLKDQITSMVIAVEWRDDNGELNKSVRTLGNDDTCCGLINRLKIRNEDSLAFMLPADGLDGEYIEDEK